jgi:nicotinamidase-related amidase
MNTEAIYEQKYTALLIVDMYNDFMSEGGSLCAITKPRADSTRSHREQIDGEK